MGDVRGSNTSEIPKPHSRCEALIRLLVAHEDWCAAVWRADQANTDRARAMGAAYRAGATLEEIGATIGVGHSAVHHAMRRAGLDPKDLRDERVALDPPGHRVKITGSKAKGYTAHCQDCDWMKLGTYILNRAHMEREVTRHQDNMARLTLEGRAS